MTYQEVLDYLYAQLPMFHRIGPAAYKADLSNTYQMMEYLGQPFQSFPSIHIAGTNGKGSTSHMLAAVLQQAGYKTGLYTSPHLLDFRERIRINGQMISQKSVIEFVNQHQHLFEQIGPSFFEWTVALAFDYFRKEQVDIAVIETGLGGRLDSTNVITPLVSVITNIGWDHASLLGDTLPKIAGEKAGIIKKNIPVVIGERQSSTDDVFFRFANAINSPIVWAEDTWKVDRQSHNALNQQVRAARSSDHHSLTISLDLPGLYQLKNTATVLQTVDNLRQAGMNISDEHIITALSNVKQLTGFMGRWHSLSEQPLVIADVGHNEDGIKQMVKQLTSMQYEKLHLVMGVVADKDLSGILGLLPTDATYYFCAPALPRALPATTLAIRAQAANLKGDCYENVEAAVRSACSNASKNDLVLITGSTFVVAEALPVFMGKSA